MSSQQSFASKLGKFENGNTALNGLTDYNPANVKIQKSSLVQKDADVIALNSAVTTSEEVLKKLQKERKFLAYTFNGGNDNNIQGNMKAIEYNLRSELSADSPEYLKVKSINQKIQPPSEKKKPLKEGETPKKSNSKSEKSYQSLVGFGNDVCTIITNLGTNYNPANQNITVVNFKAQVARLNELNGQVTTAEKDYSTAVKNREKAYNGEDGISSLISTVKDHLASLEGGKKNPSYVAYANAVK